MPKFVAVGRAILMIPLAGVAWGCSDADEACASGCPVTGRAAQRGDIRLQLDTENSSVVIEDASSFADGMIMAGELTIRPDTPECVGLPEHPCRATIQRLTVTITDLTAGDFSFSEPTLSIDAPLEVLDAGMGYGIPDGTSVHNCVVLRGAHQHAEQEAENAAIVLFDDVWSPGGWAHLTAWWPFVLAFPMDRCSTRTLNLVINASFVPAA